MPRFPVLAKPFLKWVGGKRQLLSDLLCRVDRLDSFRRYHEPFLGGGALFFELRGLGRLDKTVSFLSDNNGNLIDAYKAIRRNVDAVVKWLRAHESRHGKDYYYELRGYVPSDLFERAARIIYLNRTCYNGLYRENRKGEFNVPFGKYKNPRICDEENLRAVAEALQRTKIERRDFETVLDVAEPADLVYFDPPYHPVSKTASFTAYAKEGFGEESQRRLAAVFEQLADRGVKVILSNSDTDFVRELYDRFCIETVRATRAVNSRADRRGKVNEVIVTNF